LIRAWASNISIMIMNMLHNVFAFVIFLSMVQSCGPVISEQPLTEVKNPQADLRLAGAWYDKSQKMFCHFVKRNTKLMDMVIVMHKESGEPLIQFELFTSKIENSDFMNLKRIVSGNSKSPDYKVDPFFVFAKYKIKDRKLTIEYLEDRAFKIAINSGKLKGTTSSGNKDYPMFVTDSTPNLIKFIKKKGQVLFAKFGSFQKISM